MGWPWHQRGALTGGAQVWVPAGFPPPTPVRAREGAAVGDAVTASCTSMSPYSSVSSCPRRSAAAWAAARRSAGTYTSISTRQCETSDVALVVLW